MSPQSQKTSGRGKRQQRGPTRKKDENCPESNGIAIRKRVKWNRIEDPVGGEQGGQQAEAYIRVSASVSVQIQPVPEGS